MVVTRRIPAPSLERLEAAPAERRIAGAALDVLDSEPALHPGLLPLENVVIVPHLGSARVETRTAMAQPAVTNCLAVLAGDVRPSPSGGMGADADPLR